ncbi:MAG: hypothetical protein ACTSRP_25390 [Candidatus Helarchaeota archaeon]
MDPNDYFDIANLLVKIKSDKIPNEIFYRTAINRLYYGIFHLVQIKYKIFIPRTQVSRCHAYVKEQIEQTNILGDYTELEAYRVSADYEINKKININHFRDALRIQQRILKRIIEPEEIPYEDEDEFFFKHRNKS